MTGVVIRVHGATIFPDSTRCARQLCANLCPTLPTCRADVAVSVHSDANPSLLVCSQDLADKQMTRHRTLAKPTDAGNARVDLPVSAHDVA